METSGGMRELVERADQVLVLDGCPLACGTRLLKGAFPQIKPTAVFTDGLFEFDRTLFSVDEMPEAEIKTHARAVAERVIAERLDGVPAEPIAALTGCTGR